MISLLRRQALIVGWSACAAGAAFAYGVLSATTGPMRTHEAIALVSGIVLTLVAIAAPFELTERGRRLTARWAARI